MNVFTWCMWSACLLAWIGSVCSRVALQKWGWHHRSPVSPPPQVSVTVEVDSPAPRPVHSRLCDDWSSPRTVTALLVAACSSPEQCDAKSDGEESNQAAPRSVPIFSCVIFPLGGPFGWIPSPHQRIQNLPRRSPPTLPTHGQSFVGGCLFLYWVLQMFYSWDGLCLTL